METRSVPPPDQTSLNIVRLYFATDKITSLYVAIRH